MTGIEKRAYEAGRERFAWGGPCHVRFRAWVATTGYTGALWDVAEEAFHEGWWDASREARS